MIYLPKFYIDFENKDGSLYGAASLKSGFTLTINPKKVTDADKLFAQLAPLVASATFDKETFVAKAAKDDQYEEVAKRVDQESGVKISELKLPGVSLSRDKWRIYPGGKLAAQTLGFVGYNGDVLDGRYGLERSDPQPHAN